MLTHILLLPLVATATPDRGAPATPSRALVDRPRVEVWTNRGDDVFSRGDRARVYIRADRDAFVTVFRVDTDGRIRVLFPREPWEDTYVRGSREFEVEGDAGGRAFHVDDYPGVGYVFAVAAVDPFDYAGIVTGDHWDYRVIADGRVRGDPYVALTDLAERIVAEGYEDWDYDIAPYYVERHYDYPRFACYDCHAYASWTYWDPYAFYCSRFRIVIYDDPWYYPYRYYGGTRVVWVRPYRPAPRFVFKEWGGVARDRDPFIVRTRTRPDEVRTREIVRRAPRGLAGSIPAPRVRGPVPGRGTEDRGLDDSRGRVEPPARAGETGGRRQPERSTERDRRPTTSERPAPSRGRDDPKARAKPSPRDSGTRRGVQPPQRRQEEQRVSGGREVERRPSTRDAWGARGGQPSPSSRGQPSAEPTRRGTQRPSVSRGTSRSGGRSAPRSTPQLKRRKPN